MEATMPPVRRRACVHCTSAKAKCTPQTPDLCQRCARLGKECTYLDLPQTKRKHRAKGAPSVRTLEKKVDQLMSELAVLKGRSTDTGPASVDSIPDREDETHIAALLDAANEPSHGIDPPSSSGLQGQPSIVERLRPGEAGRLLASFKLDFVPKFPFVLLSHSKTAAHLQIHEPFLLVCVISVTMGSAHPLRKSVTQEIMQHVTTRVVARSERSLELLCGLLVHCAWYSYPAEKYHPRLLLLLQLCASILHDLGLHKKPKPTLDEQRAVLGTYWLLNSVYSNVGRPLAMKHDRRIDDCLKGISSSQHLSDSWIGPLINIQSFLSTVDEVYASTPSGSEDAFLQVTHGSLQRQLVSVRELVERDLLSCPPSTANAIRIELQYAQLRLDELSLHKDLWAAPDSAVRQSMLMSLIQRSRELIQTVIPLSAPEISQMTITTNARICAAVGYIPTAVVALLNLTPEAQAVIDAADYPALVNELANAMETKVNGMSAADRESDVVGSLCLKTRLLARCYPYQVKQIVGNAPGHRMGQEANPDLMTRLSPSGYVDLENMFPVEEMQWEALLSDFTGQFG